MEEYYPKPNRLVQVQNAHSWLNIYYKFMQMEEHFNLFFSEEMGTVSDAQDLYLKHLAQRHKCYNQGTVALTNLVHVDRAQALLFRTGLDQLGKGALDLKLI